MVENGIAFYVLLHSVYYLHSVRFSRYLCKNEIFNLKKKIKPFNKDSSSWIHKQFLHYFVALTQFPYLSIIVSTSQCCLEED